ncbi:MAG: hypothetical protein ACI8PZ_001195 [Myxococcota bacterium]|jgi:hypothetical protein
MASALTADLDLDSASVAPPMIATLSGLALIASGLMVSAAGAQLWVFVTFYSWWLVPVPYLLTALGLLAMVLGGLTTRARFWAAASGTLIGGLMVVACFVWTAYSLYAGMTSGVGILATLFATASALLMPFTLLPVLKTDRARRALYT